MLTSTGVVICSLEIRLNLVAFYYIYRSTYFETNTNLYYFRSFTTKVRVICRTTVVRKKKFKVLGQRQFGQ